MTNEANDHEHMLAAMEAIHSISILVQLGEAPRLRELAAATDVKEIKGVLIASAVVIETLDALSEEASQ